ncbi:MAG TPA: hypothetical protein VFK94_02140 [Patescibacteria group bacterium]|nr:hypothetical protein [Patescibacteria group bacterium]
MQFTHFDGSLTPVPSIGDALSALRSREREFVTQTERFMDRRNDEYLPDGNDSVLDYDSNDLSQSVVNEAATDWNETPYGFYREDVTRRYQAKLLNVFRTKDGTLSVGSVRVTTGPSTTALCVKCKVECSLTPEGFYGLFDYDLDLMQQFTRWVIQHGNEHKARIIDDRIVERVLDSRDNRSEILARAVSSAR